MGVLTVINCIETLLLQNNMYWTLVLPQSLPIFRSPDAICLLIRDQSQYMGYHMSLNNLYDHSTHINVSFGTFSFLLGQNRRQTRRTSRSWGIEAKKYEPIRASWWTFPSSGHKYIASFKMYQDHFCP